MERAPRWYELPLAQIQCNADGDAAITILTTDGGIGDVDLTANGVTLGLGRIFKRIDMKNGMFVPRMFLAFLS